MPFFNVYTAPTGSGDVGSPPWYHSRQTYTIPFVAPVLPVTQAIYYIGQDPRIIDPFNSYPQLPHIRAHLGPFNPAPRTEFAPTEILEYITLQTDTLAPNVTPAPSSSQIVVYSLAYCVNGVYRLYQLTAPL